MPTPLRALIVEDTPDDAELMLLHLTAEGFQPDLTRVQTETDYLAALAAQPDLILADWSLPQFSGLRALQLMRERGLDIPFVIVSGSVGEEAAVDALRQGAYDYVLKDRPARLGQAVRRALEDSQLRQERKRAEESLKKAATDWETTFDATTDGIYLLDRDHRIIRINRALERMLNIRKEDAVGKLCWQVIHGTSQPIPDCPLMRAKESKQRESLDYKAGERHFEFVVDPILDDSGVLTGAVHVVRDITERKRAEEALRWAEERYHRLFAEAPLMDVITRSQAVVPIITDCNQAFLSALGYNRDEVVGRSLADFYTPESRAALLDNGGYLRALDGQFLSEERALVARDGRVIQTMLTAVPEIDTEGNVMGTRAMFMDITERKRAEAELHRANAFLDSVIENIPNMVFLKDARDLRFVRFNRAGEELLGQSRDDLLGKNDYDFFPQEQADFFTEKDRAVLRQKKVMDISEELIQTRDKGVLTLHTKKVPVLNALGEPEYLLGISEDITARKQIEAEREQLLTQIQAQARQLAQVMRTVPEGVLLLDAAGRVVLANARAEEDLIALAGAQVGDPLSHLGDRPLAELLNAPPKGLWHEARAGSRSFEIIARPIATGPNPDNWVLVLRDVTQEREAQQQALQGERLAAVGQLAAGIAHDFNNLLAVIALDTRLALTAPGLTVGVRARLATISGQALRAADLVRQILDFSRHAVLERRPVALRPFLAEQIALLARTLPENIALELAGADDDCTVSADPSRLQQAVMNLAVNARDAMPEGGRLRFTLARVPALPSDLQPAAAEAAAWVRLTVADSGTGIPPEVLPRIFEPFFTTKEPGKGSGLGLAQIHGIVKQHGGEISVSTQADVGTTFTLYLPALAEAAADEPVVVADEAPAAAGQTILIVEDDPTLRDALVDTVDLLGYRTLSAAN
ncbi:MAG: PAS domain S-box protein, partial [Chloroflexi bacterium]|nr:PAS domain S-box protein [Chloroflexota bacterium]